MAVGCFVDSMTREVRQLVMPLLGKVTIDFWLYPFDLWSIFCNIIQLLLIIDFQTAQLFKNHVAVHKTGVYYLKSIIYFRWHRNTLWNKRRENDGQLWLILFNWCPTLRWKNLVLLHNFSLLLIEMSLNIPDESNFCCSIVKMIIEWLIYKYNLMDAALHLQLF